MNTKTIFLLVLICTLTIPATATKPLKKKPQQTKKDINYKNLVHIFKEKFLKDNSKAADLVFAQIQTTAQTGANINQVDDKIRSYIGVLEDNQGEDDDYYTDESVRLQNDITDKENQIHELQMKQQFLAKKLQIIVRQRDRINELYEVDTKHYQARSVQQEQMRLTMEQLVKLLKENFLDDWSIPTEKTQHIDVKQAEEFLVQLKQLGKGNHVQALAELTKLLSRDEIEEVYNHMLSLLVAIKKSVEQDNKKENRNKNLYIKLLDQLDSINPKVQKEYQDTQEDIEIAEAELVVLNKQYVELGEAYQGRKETRNEAKAKAQEANDLLEQNMERLTNWEDLVTSDYTNEDADE